MTKIQNGGPQLTWANLVATAAVMMMMVGAFWTLIQTQFSSYEKRDVERREEIKAIQAELLVRRSEFPTQFEFKQFEKQMHDRWQTQADINKNALDAYLSAKAFIAWKEERDKRVQLLEQRVNELEKLRK